MQPHSAQNPRELVLQGTTADSYIFRTASQGEGIRKNLGRYGVLCTLKIWKQPVKQNCRASGLGLWLDEASDYWIHTKKEVISRAKTRRHKSSCAFHSHQVSTDIWLHKEYTIDPYTTMSWERLIMYFILWEKYWIIITRYKNCFPVKKEILTHSMLTGKIIIIQNTTPLRRF